MDFVCCSVAFSGWFFLERFCKCAWVRCSLVAQVGCRWGVVNVVFVVKDNGFCFVCLFSRWS